MTRAVTERDFRMEEFRDAKPEDYEFRGDGKIVRKDRWETSMRAVARLVGSDNGREFELADVVDAVRELVAGSTSWVSVADTDPLDLTSLSRRKQLVDLRLIDGSILCKAARDDEGQWVWNPPYGAGRVFVTPVEWRESQGGDA